MKQARSPQDLRDEVMAFIRMLQQPVLVDGGGSVFSLDAASDPASGIEDTPLPDADGAASGWRLEVEYGKLLLECWGDGRSMVRRLESAERDAGRLVIEARKPGGFGPPIALEIRDAGDCAPSRRGSESPQDDSGDSPTSGGGRDRAGFEREVVTMLAREYPGARLERVTHRSNRERSFSGCYTRGWARRGREAWAFLGLSEFENPSAVENALVYGLIWLDWLRERASSGQQALVVSGLKLVLPPAAVAVAAHRAAYLDPHAAGIEILEWTPAWERPRAVDLSDYGNVETRLTPRRRGARLLEQCRPLVRELLGPQAGSVRVVPDSTGETLSLRVFGLEVARIEGGSTVTVTFGLEGHRRPLDSGNRADFDELLANAVRLRRARCPDRSHPLYRLQPERWLESLLVDDITHIDPALMPEHVYPQVPAFSGTAGPAFSRGVIDILGVTRDAETGTHRLAVVELKLDEDPNLPLQGLDYWLRVNWLADRGQFHECGYFPGLTPSPAPVIYLVCPAFRFHSTTERVLRYFQPAIRVVKVGVNQRWREGVKVLFRRTLEQGRVIGEREFESPCDDGISASEPGFSRPAGTGRVRHARPAR